MTGGVTTDELRFPLDRRGYFRRECQDCHRQFKVRWSDRDALLVQRRVLRLLAHENGEELEQGPSDRHCPYCGCVADPDEWWTEEQRILLAKRAAQLGEEIRFEQLRLVERTLDQNPFPTFLAVRPEPFRYRARPEPDDMRVVPLLCCGEDVKVRDSWQGEVFCPYCGARHDLPRR